MSRDYAFVCISCREKSDKIMSQYDDPFEAVSKAEHIDDLFLIAPVNFDTDKLEPLKLHDLLGWLDKHKSHSEIAFEVIP